MQRYKYSAQILRIFLSSFHPSLVPSQVDLFSFLSFLFLTGAGESRKKTQQYNKYKYTKQNVLCMRGNYFISQRSSDKEEWSQTGIRKIIYYFYTLNLLLFIVFCCQGEAKEWTPYNAEMNLQSIKVKQLTFLSFLEYFCKITKHFRSWSRTRCLKRWKGTEALRTLCYC